MNNKKEYINCKKLFLNINYMIKNNFKPNIILKEINNTTKCDEYI